MKKLLLLSALLSLCVHGFSQIYHADDKAALQNFMMQDAVDGQKNYMHLGFTAEPDWNSEEWVAQTKGLTWRGGIPHRLGVINW